MIRIVLLALAGVVLSAQAALRNPETYFDMCGASAAVALDETHFVVGDDEGNSLRVYERGVEHPIRVFDLSRFLVGRKRGSETDLEGAARVGDLIYWIGSHGRNREGDDSPSRRRLFAVKILAGGKVLEPVGEPYVSLLSDLAEDARFAKYKLGEAAKLSAKALGGLNIEGLCARPDGSLLIGFRSPIPNGKTLLLPLLNPTEVIEGQKGKFGEMVELDLQGLGVRDMTLDGGRYLIIAGSHHSGNRFELFSWDGAGAAKHVKHVKFGKLNPEAIFRFPTAAPGVFEILSDDGSEKLEGKECGELPSAKRRFRAVEITVH